MAAPVRKPARTSDQWLRYSATRTTPTRKAGHSRARQSEGLTRREPFTRNTSVTYICGSQTGQGTWGGAAANPEWTLCSRLGGVAGSPGMTLEREAEARGSRKGSQGNRSSGDGVTDSQWVLPGTGMWAEHQRAVDSSGAWSSQGSHTPGKMLAWGVVSELEGGIGVQGASSRAPGGIVPKPRGPLTGFKASPRC